VKGKDGEGMDGLLQYENCLQLMRKAECERDRQTDENGGGKSLKRLEDEVICK
jgi:hypothetical protein